MTPQLLPEQKKDLFFTFQTAMKKLYLENFKGFRLLTRTLVRVTVALDLSKRRKKKKNIHRLSTKFLDYSPPLGYC